MFLSSYEAMLYTLKGLFNFTLNDSVLLILLPTLLIYRIYMFVCKNDRTHIFWDCLLLCGFLYICAFIKLNLFDSYYLIPIYYVSFGSILYFLFVQGYISSIFFKILTILCLSIFTINNLPSGVFQFIWLKSEGVKFHNSLAFITKEAQKKTQDSQNITLYFEGNGRGELYNNWYWIYFARYLEEIYNVHNFDIKAKDENSPTLWQKTKNWKLNESSHLSIYKNDKVSTPKSGDFIILHNSTYKNANASYMHNLEAKYTLIYQSDAFTLPYIGLKPLLKILFAPTQILKDATHNNQNFLKLPMRDYIFKVP